MNLSIRRRRFLLNCLGFLGIGSIVLLVAIQKLPHMPLWPFSLTPKLLLAPIAVFAIVYRRMWICPGCKNFLGQINVSNCSHCAYSLNDEGSTFANGDSVPRVDMQIEFSRLLESERSARIKAKAVLRVGSLLSSLVFALLFFSTKASPTDPLAWLLVLIVGILAGRYASYFSYLLFVLRDWRCPTCRANLESPYAVAPGALHSCPRCRAVLQATPR